MSDQEIPGVSEMLCDVPMLSNLPDDRKDELVRAMRLQHFEAGAVLLQEGEAGHQIYFILRGRVRIWSDSVEAWMAEMGPGSMVGEIGAFLGTLRTATVRALERVCVASISGPDLLQCLSVVPTVLDSIFREARERYLRTHGPKAQHGDVEQGRSLAKRRIPQFSSLTAEQQDRILNGLIKAPVERLIFGHADRVIKVVLLEGEAILQQGFLPHTEQVLNAGSTGTLDSAESWLRLHSESQVLILSLEDFYSLLDPTETGEKVKVVQDPVADHPGVLAEYLEEGCSLEGDLPLRHGLVAVLGTPMPMITKQQPTFNFIVDETPKSQARRYRDDPLPIESKKLVISSSENELEMTAKRLSPKIEEIVAIDCPWPLDEFLEAVATKCNNLKVLDLSGSQVSEDALVKVVSSIDTITVLRCPAITDRVLQEAHGEDLLLESLDISGSSRVGWKHIIRFHATLRQLCMRRCWWEGELTLKGTRIFTCLEELDLSENPFLSDGQLMQIVSLIPNLKRLNLSLCSSLSSSCVMQLGHLDLTHLNLSFCMRAMTDEVVVDGISSMKGLKSLCLKSCVQLTNRALKALLGMSLEHLDVTDCPRITAAQLIPKEMQ